MSEIIFESLSVEPNLGAIVAALPSLRARFSDTAVDGIRGRVASLSSTLAGHAVDHGAVAGAFAPLAGKIGAGNANGVRARFVPLEFFAHDAAVETNISLLIGYFPQFGSRLSGHDVHHDDLAVGFSPMRSRIGSGIASGVQARLPPAQWLSYEDAPPVERYVSVFQSPGYVSAVVGEPFLLRGLREGIGIRASESAQPTYALIDAMRFDDASSTSLEALMRMHDGIGFGDVLGVIWRLLVSEGIGLDDGPAASQTIVAAIVDALRLFAGPGATQEVLRAVASALALRDVNARVHRESLSDSIAIADEMQTLIEHYLRMLDSIALSATPAGTAVIGAIVEEAFALGDTAAWTAEVLARLRSGLELSLSIRIDDDVFVAWVMNAETKAFSSYEQFPFNSFAHINGRYYGCSDDGIYELSGDDDDGEPIAARVRTGLSNLGTGRMKRIPSMYLGYTADGALVLKVVTTSPQGDKEEHWYRLTPRTAHATREGRIKIGRGLKSVFWGFEISNVDGAQFALDDLQLFPMMCDRRI